MHRPACGLLLVAVLGAGGAVRAADAAGDYPLRYQFRPGEAMVYETTTRTEGMMKVGMGADEPRGAPVNIDLISRVRLTVLEAVADGGAKLELRLEHLHISSAGPWDNNGFELRDTGAAIEMRQGEQVTVLPDVPAGEAEGGEFKPASLMIPTVLTMTADGAVTAASGKTWVERLADAPMVGMFAPLLQSLGPAVPELPGKPLPLGQDWRQTREMALPGGQGTYPMELLFLLAKPVTMGPYKAVRIEFEGASKVADRRIPIELMAGLAAILRLDRLDHEAHGSLAFDAGAGRLVEQRLTSHLTADGRSDNPNLQFTVAADVTIDSTMLLLSVEEPPAAAPG